MKSPALVLFFKGILLLIILASCSLTTLFLLNVPLSKSLLNENKNLVNFILLITMAFYFLGSIPFGLILTKAGGLGDIRKIGSGNIGATNVLRAGNKSIAAATLFLDALKGFLCVFIASSEVSLNYVTNLIPVTALLEDYHGIPLKIVLQLLAATVALLGHLYPVWLSFKGGKGIATLAGILLSLSPTIWITAIALWIVIFLKTRLSSLAAICALVLTPAVTFVIEGAPLGLWLTGISTLLLWRHKDNAKRLITGKEGKIGTKGIDAKK